MSFRMAYSYGCLMVMLPEPLADEVKKLASSIPTEFIVKPEEEPHVTIQYGILTDDPEEVATAVCGYEQFPVVMGRVVAFHGAQEPVLRVAVQREGPYGLRSMARRALKVVDRFPTYRPHVTVAYLKGNAEDPYYYTKFFGSGFEGKQFMADSVVFSTPAGGRHVLPLNGARTAMAGRLAVAERIARDLTAGLEVRISPMEPKVEISDGRQTMSLSGSRYDVGRIAQDLKWDISRLSRMRLDEAKKFIDEKLGGKKLKWDTRRG